MRKKRSPKELAKRLRQCQQDYGRIKTRIREVGFICEGSLVERWMACGKPNCRCSADPAQRHGPYYQLSWKEAGKTISRRLPPEQARLYEEWIANRRQLESLLNEMRVVSLKAGRYLLDAAAEPDRTRQHPHSARPRKT